MQILFSTQVEKNLGGKSTLPNPKYVYDVLNEKIKKRLVQTFAKKIKSKY